jgi:hypothetical protein
MPWNVCENTGENDGDTVEDRAAHDLIYTQSSIVCTCGLPSSPRSLKS